MRLLTVVATATVAVVTVMPPGTASAQPPAQTPQPTPAPPARLPFPAGATHAYVDLQQVASQSREGQAANQRVQTLTDEKRAEIETRNASLQASQQQLQQNSNVASPESQLLLQREIERMTVDIQRMTQDAESDIAQLQQTLQIESNERLFPALEQVGASRGLQFIFSVGDGGLVWANPALDVTADVIQALDAGQVP